MSKKNIRPITIAVLKRKSDGALLLDRGYDTKKNEYFYRALGGGIEYGETSVEALVREFQEEIGKHIEVTKQLGVTENIFTYNGDLGHQIVFIHEAVFADNQDYSLDKFVNIESEEGFSVWKTIDEIKQEGAKLYPEVFESLAA